jgi:predicted amidophosphoribosyltransferase
LPGFIFARIRGSVCRECGFPIDAVSGDENIERSGELLEDVSIGCRSEKFHFDRARSFARYQDSLVRAIVLLKFEEMEPLADWFADRLAEVVRQNGEELEADVMVPVPLHRTIGGASANSTRRNCCQNDWLSSLGSRTRRCCW